jgi:hypothetical protein
MTHDDKYWMYQDGILDHKTMQEGIKRWIDSLMWRGVCAESCYSEHFFRHLPVSSS